MPTVDHALIHRARIVSTQRSRTTGTRDAQGQYPGAPEAGPWFPARRMSKRGNVATVEDGSVRRRGVTIYSLMWGTEDEVGAPLVAPSVSDRLEVDVYGTTSLWEITDPPLAFDSGTEIFGGQADIESIADSG